MKFFSIFTLIVMQIFIYAFARYLIWQGNIQAAKTRKLLYFFLFIFGNGIVATSLLAWSSWLFRLSALWLVVLLFSVLTGIIIWLLNFFGAFVFRRPEKRKRILRIISPLIFLSFFAMGLYNAYTPVVRYAKIQINKPLEKPLRIAMASDFHLGILVGARQLDKFANIMAQEKPDMILLPGDIMDDNTLAYDAENMRPHLAKLHAPLGVYATLGNHDLFGHEREISDAIRAAGITLLNDDVIKIRDFWIVGRPDNLDKHRAKTADLLRQTNPSEAVILLDHRPDSIDKHSHLPLDIQVSGHVHNGQIFPANFIVKMLNRIAYGYGEINGRHFFVSSGYGFWGIPLRLGSQSEVWMIDVEGKK